MREGIRHGAALGGVSGQGRQAGTSDTKYKDLVLVNACRAKKCTRRSTLSKSKHWNWIWVSVDDGKNGPIQVSRPRVPRATVNKTGEAPKLTVRDMQVGDIWPGTPGRLQERTSTRLPTTRSWLQLSVAPGHEPG